ncbi:hypothetical protein SDC9_208023 [bioreactor metagenome]|uniref:Uncharacterized protein n=1 Tax=bioreactor metagenome TaxID=1076179 RepID=A0A645J9C9_9ZZZZ
MRCVITKVNDNNYEGKDYNGRKYLIVKNEATKNYKLGTDSTFYATKRVEGLMLKKIILEPLTTDEYEYILSKEPIINKQ